MKFIGRISGVVSYEDNTNDRFAAHLDERGNVSVNAAYSDGRRNDSNHVILEIQDDNNWLEDTLTLLSNSLALAPVGVATKTVNDAVIHFTGRVSRSDNTWEDFAVSYDVKSGAHIVEGSGTGQTVAAYDEFPSDTIEVWLESIVGVGRVSSENAITYLNQLLTFNNQFITYTEA